MRVFITGSSGLIGKWTMEKLLSEEFVVKGFDKVESPYDHLREFCVVSDILDSEALEREISSFKPDALIHLAARVDLDGRALEDYSTNIEGVRNLCSAVRKAPSVQRTIFTSSQLVCKVGYIPISDNDFCPSTTYGNSKVLTEKIVREEDGGGCTWCITRPTTVWGPFMSPHYQSLLEHIKRGHFFHSGPEALYKSYAYAENIAYQYYKLLTCADHDISNQVFYLADYTPLSLRDYADNLAKELKAKQPITIPYPISKALALIGDLINSIGFKFPYNSFRLKNIRTEYIFDLSKTERVCGPLPVNFSEGVKATADWFTNEKRVVDNTAANQPIRRAR